MQRTQALFPERVPQSHYSLTGTFMAKVLETKPETGRVLVELYDGSQQVEAFVMMAHGNDHSGLTWIPEVDDLVVVAFLQGKKALPVILGAIYDQADTPTAAEADQFVLRHQSGTQLTIEAEGDVTLTHVGGPEVFVGADTITLTAEGATVEIEPTGDVQVTHPSGATVRVDETKVELQNDGSIINIEADGDIRLQFAGVDGPRIRVGELAIFIQDTAGNEITIDSAAGKVTINAAGTIEIGGNVSVALAGEITGPQIGSGGSHTHQIVGTSVKLKAG